MTGWETCIALRNMYTSQLIVKKVQKIRILTRKIL